MTQKIELVSRDDLDSMRHLADHIDAGEIDLRAIIEMAEGYLNLIECRVGEENLRLLHDRVLILPARPVTEKNGLAIIGSLDKGPRRGVVLAVGSKLEPSPSVAKGDVVIFADSDKHEIKIDDDTLVIVPISEVLMKL